MGFNVQGRLRQVAKNAMEYIRGSSLAKSFRLQKAYARLSRVLAMQGIALPLKSRASVDHWASQTLESRHSPMKYAYPDEYTEILFADILPYLPKETSFLEVGCNAGGNLKYLYDRGYRNLTGIELNKLAVEQVLREVNPDLYSDGHFLVGNAADEIRKLPDAAYDVVFAKGVLVHIPPKDQSLFDDMVRVSRRYIVVHTGEMAQPFPYDFEKIFKKRGCKLIVYKSFFGENGGVSLPSVFFSEKSHFFSEISLRVFIKNTSG
jgi:SAM-dependent methyltransferase